jgi:exodeoxyribonuclease-3
MRIATWNINGIRARLDALLGWLDRHRPDALCLQETKVQDEDFPRLEIEAAGYAVEFWGQKSYNGVALLSREPATEVKLGFAGDDGEEKRVISGTVGGVRVVSVYVPNGRSVGSEHYHRKLDWMQRFRASLAEAHSPRDAVAVCGDFNVAPEDRDVHKPERWRGKVLCSKPEREQFRAFLDWGFRDSLRLLHQEEGIFTWWDYRLSGFQRNWGLRIDHALVTEALAGRVREVSVDREERGSEKPSDHAPLILELEDR